METSFKGKVGPLDLRVRQTLGADGLLATSSVVPCPREERLIPIEECESCDEHGGTLEEDGTPLVLCSHPKATVDRAESEGDQLRADRVRIVDIMRSAFCVKPDVTVSTIATLLIQAGISGLPVVDASGKLLGIISKTDLLAHEWDEGCCSRDDKTPVSEVMSRDALTLLESSSVADAAELMTREGVHRLPVISSKGEVLGIVTPFDLLEWLAR